ncbi:MULTISPECIES: ABC transporter permease [Streptococcus]|nr:MULTISPECIES: ABC transporter permease [Streptococcus]
MAIITIYSLTAGTFTTLIISEEKDKKNLRTLILTGVKIPEYIFSTILFPFLFSIIGVWVMPITFGISIPNLALYSLVTFLTILCFILVNFTIALFCKNQTQASAVSLIFYLVIMTFPMFSSINKFAKLLTDFSLLGAHNQYFNDISAFSLYNIQILTLLLWIVLMSALVYTGFVWNKKH